MDGDQADRALALERAEPLDDARRRQAEAAARGTLDRDQVAVLGIGGGAGRDVRAPCRAFSCRPARAARRRSAIFAEDAEHALLGMVDDLDDAAAMADAVVVVGFLDVQQHAVADAGGLARARLARK